MRSTRERLEDVIFYGSLIQDYLPAERERYDADIVLKYFLLKQVEIIGEAVFKMDKVMKNANPQIPWQKIEGIRHILVHDYFDVDWGVLWDILHQHIQPLRESVKLILHDLSDG